MVRRNIADTGLLVALLLVPAAVLASGGEPAGGNHPSLGAQLVFPAINFLTYFVILWWVYAKKILPTMKSTRDETANFIQKAQEEFAESQRSLKTIASQLSSFGQEREAILEQAKEEGENMARHVQQTAEADAQRLRDDVVRQHRTALAAAEKELREELVRKAVEQARTRLQALLSAEKDKQLRQDILRQLISAN